MKTTKYILWVLLFLFFVQPVYGWETDIKTKSGWEAIYNSFGRSMKEEARKKDEHAALSDWSLTELGVKHYSFNKNPIMITDLNASIFRNLELRSLGSYPSAPEDGELEIRQLPAPSHFSGIPDFSYSINDWINKNYFCPIPGSPWRCHEFLGWMGALNSNHFGTQAKKSYWHLHKLALNLAGHAKSLRETFSKDSGALDYYKEYIREAEREALSVEGYAQHFLQDRWSTGHMWERWNASGYSELPEKGLVANTVVAAFAGLLHGSEGVAKMPDALSSPQVTWTETYINQAQKGHVAKFIRWLASTKKVEGATTKGGYYIPQWKHVPNKFTAGFAGYNGIGDDRFLDLLDKGFGKEYVKTIGKDYPMNADMQKLQMQQCLMAGWAEVIRGFGGNPAGGFGIEQSKPRNDIKGFTSLGFKCDDMWVTNEAIAVGWRDSLTTIGQAARARVQAAKSIYKYITFQKQSAKDRQMFITISYRIRKFNAIKSLRHGTGLAQGLIGSFGNVKTGNHYTKLANYVEPKNITDLPDDDDGGMDKKAWFGFFNRSHSGYWCERDSVDLLNTLRSSDKPVTQKACVYLADRFYEGTWLDYKGDRSEERTMTGKVGGEKVKSVCSLLGKSGKRMDPYPTHLHPGYVEKPYARNDDGVLKSIVNWCREVPVINYIKDDSGEMQKNWVQTFEKWDEKITLSGSHLGQKGKITFACNSSQSTKIDSNQIENWNSLAISFYPPEKF
ncbi:MAG: hypothetical protein Q9M20_04305, partial [Mariprofundaceae bacterium]|nr:hypothetical protein [Mariprofundaceae bacterium]